MGKEPRDWAEWVLLAVGIFLLLFPVAIAAVSPTILINAQLFLRIIAALGGALVGAFIPGALDINLPGIKAAGALGVVVLVYATNPPVIAATSSNPLTPPTETERALIKATVPDGAGAPEKVTVPDGAGAPEIATVPDGAGAPEIATVPEKASVTPSNVTVSSARLRSWLFQPNGEVDDARFTTLQKWMDSSAGFKNLPVTLLVTVNSPELERGRQQAITDLKIP